MPRALARLLARRRPCALCVRRRRRQLHDADRRRAARAPRRGHDRRPLSRPLLGRGLLALERPQARLGRRSLGQGAARTGLGPRPLGAPWQRVVLHPGHWVKATAARRRGASSRTRPAARASGSRPSRHRPAPESFWVAGHWRWENNAHVWVPGRWETRRVDEVWVPAHWVHEHGHWNYVGGRWRHVVTRPAGRPSSARREIERRAAGFARRRACAAATIRSHPAASRRHAPTRRFPSAGPW